MKSLLLLSALLALTQAKVQLQVHTTSGCSDTVWFIQNQLIPTYLELADYVDVEIVPWGRTTRNANGLSCQFGIADCWANRVHRCALDILSSAPLPARMSYINCEFASFTDRPAFEGSYACVRAAGILQHEVEACVDGTRGDELDQAAQEKATEPMQVINFVPAIVFDGSPVYVNSAAAFVNLRSVLCMHINIDPSNDFTC